MTLFSGVHKAPMYLGKDAIHFCETKLGAGGGGNFYFSLPKGPERQQNIAELENSHLHAI